MKDPFGGFRLLRISIVRDLLKEQGELPVRRDAGVGDERRAAPDGRPPGTADGERARWNPRWDLRPRESRVKPWPDLIDLAKRGWAARSRPSPRAVA